MANFDYANVFYKNKIFSLSDVNLFRNKVEEAEKIDNFFLYVIPNMNHIRDYIIYSYIFEKNLAIEDRINYIKGLVYASDYGKSKNKTIIITTLKNILFGNLLHILSQLIKMIF